MKIKIEVYFFFFLALILTSSCASRKYIFFQTSEERKGKVVNLPSLRNENIIRFQPDDILAITVNVPGEQLVATDYNLPLVPSATSENSTEDNVSTGSGRQAFLIRKDGMIDFPVLGMIKAAGFTQAEFEDYIKQLLSEKLKSPAVVTVRLQNFQIWLTGEINGAFTVNRDHISLLEALALGGGLTPLSKRDDIVIFRPTPDGGYIRASVDISREDIIWSPYFYLHQNDIIYVQPTRVRTQSIDISPRYSFVLGVASLAFTVFVLIRSYR